MQIILPNWKSVYGATVKIALESSSLLSNENVEKMDLQHIKKPEMLGEELQATLNGLSKIQIRIEKAATTKKIVNCCGNYHFWEDKNMHPLPSISHMVYSTVLLDFLKAFWHVHGRAHPKVYHQ